MSKRGIVAYCFARNQSKKNAVDRALNLMHPSSQLTIMLSASVVACDVMRSINR